MLPLDPAKRLALAYAPAAARPQWLAVLAIDARIAETALRSGEAMLRQLRLAWWRDQLLAGTGADPALIAVRSVGLDRDPLTGLVDGWEELVTADTLSDAAVQACVTARADLLVNLAQVLGCSAAEGAIRGAAAHWARVDLGQSLNLPHPVRSDDAAIPLPRAMRPLAVLAGLARRSLARGGNQTQGSALDLLIAMRIGLLGR